MDLVKIGFQINANGLKEANTEVDKLLDKVDNIGTKGKKASSDFESSQKKVQDSVKKTEKVSTSASDKMIQKQQTINQLLPYMDKNTANLASSFWLVSKEAQSFNKFLDILGAQDAIVKQKKQTEALVKEQQKQTKAVQSTIAQYEGLSHKSLGGGVLDQIEQQNRGIEDLRKQYQAEEKEANKKAESITKAQEKQAKAVQDTVSQYENLSNKPLGNGILDQIEQQNKGLEELRKEYQSQEKAQQKALDDAEKERQKHFSTVQKDYEKQQQAIADAKQKSIDKQVKAQNTLNESNQKAITLEQAKAKYVAQGYGKTDSTRLARLEVSGADVTTLNNYKSAIEATTKATQALNPAVEKASVNHNKFLDSVKGIAIYAALSAAIYGAMTAMTTLAVSTVKVADEYTSLQNRMKLYVTDANELANVNAKLAQFAIANNVGLRETGTLFARLQPAMAKIGANTAAVTTVVDAFGKSMRIGGATAMEAASATIQFSQAMASGKLAGDEFRSISEASPRFLKAIADGSGIAAEKLKDMSAAGALTTEVISKALVKEYAKLSDENERLGYTLEQGANALKTAFTVVVGQFNEGAGITSYFGTSMVNMAEGMVSAGEAAKEMGTSVNKWFKDNAGVIKTVTTAIELMAVAYISKLAAGLVLARLESMRYQATLLTVAAAQANVTRSSLIMSSAITAAGNAAKGALAFFGGWVGLGLTVLGTVAAYAAFGRESEKVGESLRKEGDTIDDTIQKFKELTIVKQRAQLVTEQANLDVARKAYQDLRAELVTTALAFSRNNNMTSEQAKGFSQLALQYKSGKITLEQLSTAVEKSNNLSKESKNGFLLLTGGVSDASDKVGALEKLMVSLGEAVRVSGEEAKIAGTNFSQMITDAKDAVQVNNLAARYMKAFNLDQSRAVALAKEDLTLRKQGKVATMEHVKALQAEMASEEKMSDITKARTKAEKDAENARKKKDKSENRFPEQLKELQTYQKLLEDGLDVELAKIASQKEYSLVYGENLTMAREMLTIQKMIKDAENRLSFSEGLGKELEMQDRVVGFLKLGATYEAARSVAAARFLNDLKGREAVELAMTNALFDQSHKIADQSKELENVNIFLREGLSLEEAKLRVAIARIQAVSSSPEGMDNEEAAMQLAIRTVQMAQAEQASIIEINKLNKQRVAIIAEFSMGYERAAFAAAKLAATNGDITSEQALSQLRAEDALALSYEQVNNHTNLLSLLTGESEIIREIKEDYAALSDDQVAQVAVQRENLKLAEAYAEKVKEAKKHQIGDFSAVDFEVFGDFGDPFKAALDGANNYIAVLGELNDNLRTVQEAKLQLEAAEELAGLEQNFALQAQIGEQIKRQAEIELDLLGQKKDAQHAAFGQGLSFAKSLFKEESKGYKVVSGLEKAYQASKIAFALWEKKDTIAMLALSLKAHMTDMLGFTTGAAAKLAAQGAVNVAKGTEAVLTQGSGDPYTAFPRMAAMAAAVVALGVAIGSFTGGSSGGFAPTNEGTGTVFGGAEDDKSESIAKAMELLADNSELGLPISTAMLRSLRNIEGSIGGLTNLVVRSGIGSELASGVKTGFSQDFIGKSIASGYDVVNKMTFGLADTLTLGLFSSVGKFVSGLFGKKTSIKGQGLAGFDQSMQEILTGGFDLKEYVDVETKKKTFGITTSKKRSTNYSEASDELSNQFTLILTNMHESIKSAAPLLTNDLGAVEKALNDYVVNIGRIDLKGLSGEEIQERLSAIFSAEADKMAQAAFGYLGDFQTVGEGYFETLVKVASAVEGAAYYTDRLNVTAINYTDIINKQADDLAAEIIRQSYLTKVGISTIKGGMTDLVNTFNGSAEEITGFINTLEDLQDQLFMTGKNANYLTSSMILGAGGLDSLASGLDAYFEMLSPAEQAAELTRRLTNEFAIFGKELPADVKAFRALVSSIDITTEAGQKLYGQIIALAPEFNDLQDALESANSDVNALVQSLRDLAEQARAARGETEQPRNLAYLRNEFNKASELALQGDTEAANRLISIGKDLMSMSKLYSVTGSDYAKDLAFIQGVATAVADIQESGLGTSISPDLKPSTGTGTTTPTIETTNSTMTTEMQTMREEFNAGLFAIAKFVQNMDSRTERWDDGDRMMVGIQPENGDTPVRVVVTP